MFLDVVFFHLKVLINPNSIVGIVPADILEEAFDFVPESKGEQVLEAKTVILLESGERIPSEFDVSETKQVLDEALKKLMQNARVPGGGVVVPGTGPVGAPRQNPFG